MLLVDGTSAGVRIAGTLAGLAPSSGGGWHVHSGYTCADADGVFGHYFTRGADPWVTTYTADAQGVAQIDETMDGFTLHAQDSQPVFGRTVVVHESDGDRGGCGVWCSCWFSNHPEAYGLEIYHSPRQRKRRAPNHGG